LKHSLFGDPDGRTIVYFHGTPGAIAEAEVIHEHAKRNGLRVICQDRFSLDASIDGLSYFQTLADDVARLAKGNQVDIIGFSIGAFVALQVYRLNCLSVRSLHLVSPAAPLNGGDFLKSMSGKQVFWLARELPSVLKLLTAVQGLLAKHAPALLFKMLFASAAAGDKRLTDGDEFCELMGRIFVDCFGEHSAGYLREVQAYVSPWEASLKGIEVKTHLWHGDHDNWSPIAMSAYLEQQLPLCAPVHVLDGLSHYSSLYAAIPRICHLLSAK
jgi:pimeloyl-ACP methyl ester carboxylesterase